MPLYVFCKKTMAQNAKKPLTKRKVLLQSCLGVNFYNNIPHKRTNNKRRGIYFIGKQNKKTYTNANTA